MDGQIAAPARANTIAPGTAPAANARPYGVPGELTAALIREWAPVLKPTGIGLLVALHSFEETAPGHPFYGWAHCTQNALAAYLDTSQDTIARYSNLLQTCGLLQVEEVETPRGKQKLYRVARGQPLPSLALLEYLVFDADTWTRKHTAWLAGGFAPLGPDTEIARLAAILARAYRVTIDARGLAGIAEGARLTRPGSYRPRRAPAAVQAPLLAAAEPADNSLSAPCGYVATPGTVAPGRRTPSAPGGQPARRRPARKAAGDPGAGESASCGQEVAAYPGQEAAARATESAASGVETGAGEVAVPPQESAPGGVVPWPANKEAANPGRESAPRGAEARGESAPRGLAGRALVNVESFNANNEKDDNDNDAPATGLSAAGGDDVEALLTWGTEALGDHASREWHRRCLQEHGAERYRWAIEATRRAQAKGPVGNPGAYFTSLLRRRGGPPASAATAADPALALAPPALPVLPESPPALAAPPAPPAPGTSLDAADCARTWQAALVHLRVVLPADDYSRILRYAVLLDLDRLAGWALLGLPAGYMREEVERRLAGPIAQALGQVCGTPVRVAAALLPGQGRLAGALPTLAERLAQQGQQAPG